MKKNTPEMYLKTCRSDQESEKPLTISEYLENMIKEIFIELCVISYENYVNQRKIV